MDRLRSSPAGGRGCPAYQYNTPPESICELTCDETNRKNRYWILLRPTRSNAMGSALVKIDALLHEAQPVLRVKLGKITSPVRFTHPTTCCRLSPRPLAEASGVRASHLSVPSPHPNPLPAGEGTRFQSSPRGSRDQISDHTPGTGAGYRPSASACTGAGLSVVNPATSPA